MSNAEYIFLPVSTINIVHNLLKTFSPNEILLHHSRVIDGGETWSEEEYPLNELSLFDISKILFGHYYSYEQVLKDCYDDYCLTHSDLAISAYMKALLDFCKSHNIQYDWIK